MPRRISRPDLVQPTSPRYSAGMRSPLTLAIAAALGAAVLAGALASATHASATRSSRAAAAARGVRQVPTLEERVLVAINELRHQNGLVPLRLNAALAQAARAHSLSMAEHGYFAHSSLSGSPFWRRVARKFTKRGWSVGENLVWASPNLSARLALAMWLASPEHRANLLAPAWRVIGLGAVHAAAARGVYEGRAATILTADFGVHG